MNEMNHKNDSLEISVRRPLVLLNTIQKEKKDHELLSDITKLVTLTES